MINMVFSANNLIFNFFNLISTCFSVRVTVDAVYSHRDTSS